MGKSLVTSKTFWANILGMALTVAKVLPPEYAAVVIAVANLLLRLVTKTPIISVV